MWATRAVTVHLNVSTQVRRGWADPCPWSTSGAAMVALTTAELTASGEEPSLACAACAAASATSNRPDPGNKARPCTWALTQCQLSANGLAVALLSEQWLTKQLSGRNAGYDGA